MGNTFIKRKKSGKAVSGDKVIDKKMMKKSPENKMLTLKNRKVK